MYRLCLVPIPVSYTHLDVYKRQALFGVLLRYNIKPFILSCCVNGVAGMIAMIIGLQGTGNGITTIPGILLYIYSPHQLIMYIILAAVTFISAFVLAWIFVVPKEVMEE